MTGLTLVEKFTTIGELVLIAGLLLVAFIFGWRGIKIIVVHRRNGD